MNAGLITIESMSKETFLIKIFYFILATVDYKYNVSLLVNFCLSTIKKRYKMTEKINNIKLNGNAHLFK